MANVIPPSLRERNRYIAFELISSVKFSRGDVVKALWASVLRFLGEYGASKTSFWVMEWDEEKQNGIIKVNNKCVDEVRSALTLLKEINNVSVIYHTLGVSGTVKKTRKKFLSKKET